MNEVLRGISLTSEGKEQLLNTFGELVPAWFLDLCVERNLAGSTFSIGEENDLSEVGAELKWMTADQMIDEGTNIYPGIAAIKKGYLPFGICLEGSGDPYFLKIGKEYEDTPVVRVPHDAVVDDQIDEACIELVALNLVEFFEKSECE